MYINGFNRQKVMETIRKNNLGKKAVDDIGKCRYRLDDGNACLVGCFIPDGKYNKAMEGMGAMDVLERFSEISSDMPMVGKALKELQEFHDLNLGVSKGEKFFQVIEKKLIYMEAKY